MVGVTEDAPYDNLRDAARPKDRRAVLRMVVESGMDLPIKVVENARHSMEGENPPSSGSR